MKRIKNYKIIVLLALVLFLSVGYAVVNSVSLSVTGTAGAVTEDIDVSFNGTKTVSNTTKGSATVTAGSKTATFSATNMALNEEITYTYTIQNNETDVAATVAVTASGSNSYFTITRTPASVTVQPGKTTTITLVVKMIKTPIESANNSANFTVSISATPTTAS